MVLKSVLRRHDAGDAALSVSAVALVETVLVEHQDVQIGRHLERSPDARDAGPNDQDVGELVVDLTGVERKEIAIERHGSALGECK